MQYNIVVLQNKRSVNMMLLMYSNTFKRMWRLALWSRVFLSHCMAFGDVWHTECTLNIYRPHSIKCVLDFDVFMHVQVTMNEQVDGVSALQHNSVCSLWTHYKFGFIMALFCSVEIKSSRNSLYICKQCTNDTIFMANWMRLNVC